MKKLGNALIRVIVAAILLVGVADRALALGKLQGHAQIGGQPFITSLTGSTLYGTRTCPGANITVKLAGTSTNAVIFSDSSLTAKSNPFNANTRAEWGFYAADGDYTLNFDGCGTTWSLVDLRIAGGGTTIACAGNTDITAQLQAAADSLTSGGKITLSAGTCNSGPVTFTYPGTHVEGSREKATFVNFVPTAHGQVLFTYSYGAAVNYESSLTNILIYSSDSTYQKIGIRLSDTSKFTLENVAMTSQFHGPTLTDTGTSIGLQIRGRELLTIKDVTINSNQPISVESNPNTAGVLDLDLAHLEDVYLLSTGGNPGIRFESGIQVTNFSMEGANVCTSNGLVLGTGYGDCINWVDKTPATATIAAGAGVDAGNHSYKVTFVDAGGHEVGHTGASNTVTTGGGDLQVNLTNIPLGNALTVTARKIYRTKVASASVWYLLATISDNTTTVYTDNTPDASLSATTGPVNATSFGFSVHNLRLEGAQQFGGVPVARLVNIQKTATSGLLRHVNFKECSTGSGNLNNGWYLRGVKNVTLDTCYYTGTATSFDADSTCDAVSFRSSQLGASTFTMTGLRQNFAFGRPDDSTQVVWNNEYWTNAANYGIRINGSYLQSFVVELSNPTGAAVNHRIFGSASDTAALGGYSSQLVGFSATAVPTPAVNAGTPFSVGMGINAANTSQLIFDTAAQVNFDDYGEVAIELNSTGTTGIIPRTQNINIDVNGVTRNRFGLVFTVDGTGAAFNLTTANIPIGTILRIKVMAAIK